MSVVQAANFMFAIDSRDVVFCASNPDNPNEAHWEMMDDIKACQLALSSNGHVAWRLDR